MTAQRRAFQRAVGLVIKELRHKAGISQAELADRIGRTQQAVSLVEQGRRAPRNADDLDVLARALGVEPSQFLAAIVAAGGLVTAVALIGGLLDAMTSVITPLCCSPLCC